MLSTLRTAARPSTRAGHGPNCQQSPCYLLRIAAATDFAGRAWDAPFPPPRNVSQARPQSEPSSFIALAIVIDATQTRERAAQACAAASVRARRALAVSRSRVPVPDGVSAPTEARHARALASRVDRRTLGRDCPPCCRPRGASGRENSHPSPRPLQATVNLPRRRLHRQGSSNAASPLLHFARDGLPRRVLPCRARRGTCDAGQP